MIETERQSCNNKNSTMWHLPKDSVLLPWIGHVEEIWKKYGRWTKYVTYNSLQENNRNVGCWENKACSVADVMLMNDIAKKIKMLMNEIGAAFVLPIRR